MGIIQPNATALALINHPRVAGSASALVGVLQFAIGAAVAPLVGLGGTKTAFPMALTIAVLAGMALLVFVLFCLRDSALPHEEAHPLP
jgi:DHA1 family bicyclomycin/chloramphenicol resistance-like MFS transporter